MRFSIITPSYKQLEWLRLCAASVRDQAGAGVEVEHIVQDAGSPGIEEFARSLGAELWVEGAMALPGASDLQGGEYTLRIYSEKDNGMYDAVNRGIKKSAGEIIAYLNCDEQYLPGALAGVRDFFNREKDVQVLFMDSIVVGPDGGYLCDRRVMVPSVLHTQVSGNLSIFTASTFSRREVFERMGLFFDSKWRDVGDADWALRLVSGGARCRAVNKPASVFTNTGDNMNTRPNALREKEEFRNAAPAWARWLAPLVVFGYRLRRAAKGLYVIRPHRYSIYTLKSPKRRVEFEVRRPTFRWPNR